MYPSQQRLTHISASLWQHLYQAQGELEKYGAGDLTATLPTLFAMYYYGVETIMQIPQEEAMPLQTEFQDNVRDLAADGLISEDQATSMLAAAWSAAEEITKVYLAELNAPQPNPIRAIVKGASGVLGLDFGEVNQLLATSLTDFVVMSAVGRHTNQK
jgi:hypothetical protein